MTRFSEAKGRQVVSTATADTVGKVADFVVDPLTRSVLAVQVRKTSSGDTLLFSAITAFGEDAVTVSGADTITEPGEDVTALLGKDHQLVGKRVLTAGGDELGKVSDIEFSAESGRLTTIHLTEGEVGGQRLLGVGSYAVVVSAE